MIEILKEELERMIEKGYPYDQILKKSQELDKYITIEFKRMNSNKNNKTAKKK